MSSFFCIMKIYSTICCSVIVLVVTAVVFPAAQVNALKFKDTFMWKCLAYPRQQQKTCKGVWTIFEQAYVGKDDSEVTAESYSELFNKTPFKHPCGGKCGPDLIKLKMFLDKHFQQECETIFYSGIKKENGQDLVHEFTENNDYFFALEDTLLGYVLDDLNWCGKKNSKETFTECGEGFPKARTSFWEMASMRCAQYACDEVTVMFDGEADKPFIPEKFFGRFELPFLQPGKVKQLTIVLITESNRNQCNNESVKNLENMVKSKKIASACKEVTKSHIKGCIRAKNYKSCW